MNTAVQALLWKNVRLTWRFFLLQQIMVITLVALTIGVLMPEEAGPAQFSDGLVLLGLIFLFIPIDRMSPRKGKPGSSFGLPYRQEYALPVSTLVLLGIPLAHVCLMLLLGYIFPMLVISTLFGLPGPQFIICLLLVILVLQLMALVWWTDNHVDSAIGWGIVLTLFWFQLTFPEISIADEDGIVSITSYSQLWISMSMTTLFLGIAFLGVQRQRHGGTLIAHHKQKLDVRQTFTIRNYFPMPKSACPIVSPVMAQIWNERQLRGLPLARFSVC